MPSLVKLGDRFPKKVFKIQKYCQEALSILKALVYAAKVLGNKLVQVTLMLQKNAVFSIIKQLREDSARRWEAAWWYSTSVLAILPFHNRCSIVTAASQHGAN